jgi:hypothetical protein
MINNKKYLVNEMKKFHEGQVDSLDCPYWLHPFRVALETKRIIEQYQLHSRVDYMTAFKVALFHDVIEDTDFTLKDIVPLLTEEEKEVAILSILLLTKPRIIFDKRVLESEYVSDQNKEIFIKAVLSDVGGTYESMIESICYFAPNLIVPLVKYNDNKDNSLIWRSKPPFNKNRKYTFSIEFLQSTLIEEIHETHFREDPEFANLVDNIKTL